MSVLRLLIVEDNEQALVACRGTVERYERERQREVKLVECRDVEEAFSMLDNSFDGAIIDLTLGNDSDAGNQIIQKIEDSQFRIPVFILTATPVNTDFAHIKVFKKGDSGAGYDDLLDRFWDIYNTGLTRIMGGRGIIEETLNKVFRRNLLVEKDMWIEYGKVNSSRTEKALLRHTLNHLLQLLDDDIDSCFPEEVYLYPPLNDEIRTGSLVKERESGKWFTVMNPACDLITREEGNRNTDRILIVEVDLGTTLFPWFNDTNLSKTRKGELKRAFGNNKSAYHHWLPKTDFFEGGFLNFRKLFTLEIEQFQEKFHIPPEIQISLSFVKDIVARFSSYYARQGQPDIDFDRSINS